MWKLIAVIALCVIHKSASSSATNFTCGSDDSDRQLVCLPTTYNRHIAPLGKYRRSQVGLSMMVTKISVTPDEAGIEIAGFLNAKWEDTRLVGRAALSRSSDVSTNLASVPVELLQHIWRPDLYVYKMRSMDVMQVLDPQSQLWVGTDDSVLLSREVRMVVDCAMCKEKFPMDENTCSVRFGSYSSDSSRLLFTPNGDGFHLFLGAEEASNTSPFSFQIKELPDEETFFANEKLGNFSITGFQVVVSRNVSPYITTVYLPSALVVALSWFSFVIPSSRIPSRFTYLGVLLLTLVSIIGVSEISTPRANVFTSLQLWFLICLLFVVCPGVEFCVVLLRQRRKMRQLRRSSVTVRKVRYEAAAGGTAASFRGPADEANGAAGEDPMDDLDSEFWRYDRVYFVILPVLFFFFNLVYWLNYAI